MVTPAKQKAVEAAAGGEGDFPSKKPKVDEVPEAMEDDLPPAVKSGDDSTPASQGAGEAPASQESIEMQANSDDDPPTDEDGVKDILNYLSDCSDVDTSAQDDIEYADLYNATPEAAEERRLYKQHMIEYRKSKGFDIETFCDVGIKPLPLDYDHEVVRNCAIAVDKAIKFKNRQNNTNLKLVKVIKSNFGNPGVYYATFEVEDEPAKKKFIYQSKVSYNHFTGKTEIYRFREKPKHESESESKPEPQPLQ